MNIDMKNAKFFVINDSSQYGNPLLAVTTAELDKVMEIIKKADTTGDEKDMDNSMHWFEVVGEIADTQLAVLIADTLNQHIGSGNRG